MPEKTARWKKFEKDTESFLLKSGFDDVKNDFKFRNTSDNRYQVDLICGFESHAIIIEAKLSDKKSVRPRINSWIDMMNGKREDFEAEVKINIRYRKYSNIHLVLALSKGIEPTQSEKKYARQKNVLIWDSQFINYYRQYPPPLRKLIPYHILADLGAKMPAERINSVVAFRLKIKVGNNSYNAYTFSTSPSELLKYCYVARREHGGNNFYQRLINSTKLSSVGDYINSGGSFVNNVVLAYDKEQVSGIELNFHSIHKSLGEEANDELIEKLDNPEYNLEVGILQFPLNYKSFWVIDGQHRLFGYVLSDKSVQDNSSLPVVLIDNISLTDQMKLFVDINTKQKAINADLIWDIYGDIEPETIFGSISNLAKEINSSGSFTAKIKIPSITMRAQINLSSFCRAIKKTGLMKENIKWASRKNIFYVKNDFPATKKKITPVLKDFFSVLEENLEGDQYQSILNSTSIEIFIAFFSLLPEVIDLKGSSSERKENFGELIDVLKNELGTDQLENISKATGESLKDEQTKELIDLVAMGLPSNTKLQELSKKINDSLGDYSKLEDSIHEWLSLVFKRYSQDNLSFDDWFGDCPEYFDKSFHSGILRNYKNRDQVRGRSKKLIDFVTLGAFSSLLKEKRIKNIFTESRKEFGTLTVKEIESHISFITPERNSSSHGGIRTSNYDQKKQSRMSTEMLMKSANMVKSGLSKSEDVVEENEFNDGE